MYVPQECHDQYAKVQEIAFNIRKNSREDKLPYVTNVRFGIDCFELRTRMAQDHPDAPPVPQPWRFICPENLPQLPPIQLGKSRRPSVPRPMGRTHTPPSLDEIPMEDDEEPRDAEDQIEEPAEPESETHQEEVTESTSHQEDQGKEDTACALGPSPKKFSNFHNQLIEELRSSSQQSDHQNQAIDDNEEW